MSKAIQLPDDVYEAVSQAAQKVGKTTDDFVAMNLSVSTSRARQDGAAAARCRVNGFLLRNIGELLCAGDPVERIDSEGRVYWRVPVWVATPDQGPIEEVGEITVDAETSEVLADDTVCSDLHTKAGAVLIK